MTVGDLTLEQTPLRLMTLLPGIGTIKPVREVLRPLGYTADEHAPSTRSGRPSPVRW